MHIEATELDGVFILTPSRYSDDRGYFEEAWNRRTMAAHGFDLEFVQDNRSLSRLEGTVRGLHAQAPPCAQTKLVRCAWGTLFDVAVDVRKGSATFGRWIGVELSARNGRQLLIPKGFLHGFVTRAPDTEIVYKCTDFYAPDAGVSVHFADPTLAIDWHVDPTRAVLSDKDAAAPAFAAFDSPFTLDTRIPDADVGNGLMDVAAPRPPHATDRGAHSELEETS